MIVKHADRKTLSRSCNANDLFLVTGGLECANCGGRSPQPELPPRCRETCSDGQPCPLEAEPSGVCWVHRLARTASEI